MMFDQSASLELLIHTFHRMHHGVMRREMEKRGLADRGNTAILFALGRHVDGQPPLTQREIADFIGISPPTVAVAVKRMEQAGLVCKQTDAKDLRKNYITLTPKGKSLVDGVGAAEREIYLRVVEGLSPEELELLRGLYLRMIENLHAAGCRGPAFLRAGGHSKEREED